MQKEPVMFIYKDHLRAQQEGGHLQAQKPKKEPKLCIPLALNFQPPEL